MTWTKTGTEYPGDCAAVELSDAAYRTHHEIIQWLYDREKFECRITKSRARKIAESETAETAMRELVAVGFWREHGTEYEVIHHADVIRQSLASQSLKKARDKKAQAAHRSRQNVSADVSAESAATQTDRQTDKQAVEASGSKECEHGVRRAFWKCDQCDARETA